MKISIITTTFNSATYLEDCIKSVLKQDYKDIEYIIIDGKSTDDTIKIANQYKSEINILISEPDNGIYDALNKGVALATGEVIGIMHSDDFFADETILNKVSTLFKQTNTDVLYGNLDYVNRGNPKKIIRKWRSKKYKENLFSWGWMPAHPTFYAKRDLFVKFGNYNLQYKSAADYDLMLRFVHKHKCKTAFLPVTMVKMRVGGVSNKSFYNRLNANREDKKAMKINGIKYPIFAIFLKPLRKITQYFT